ncbi:MAG: signal transduction histidine kinase/CheY-like chemotaxis protein [Candidatus Azotimanducaceae bacterium]|jgi:signal transduction histidine kinase/CheY-like chemotaxis protein
MTNNSLEGSKNPGIDRLEPQAEPQNGFAERVHYETPEQLIFARQGVLLKTFYKLVAALILLALALIAFLPGFTTSENVIEPFVRNVFVMITLGVLYYLLHIEKVLGSILLLIASSMVIASYTIYMESPGNLQMLAVIILPTCFGGFLTKRWQFWLVYSINFLLMLLTIWLIVRFKAVEMEYRSVVTISMLLTLLAMFIDALASSYRESIVQAFNHLKDIQRAEAQLERLDADLGQAVSQRLEAESAKKSIEQTGRMALEVAGASAIQINVATESVNLSRDFFRRYGFAPAPQSLDQLAHCIHENDIDRFHELLSASKSQAHRTEGDFRTRTAKEHHWMFVLECNETDQKTQLLDGIIVDVTNRLQEQRKRVAEESKIQESQRLESLGVLAGAIAHDFNNLLHVIMLNADLARQSLNPDSKSATSLERVMITVERATELCSELLAYSGRGHFTIEPFSAEKLVTEMKSLLNISTPKGVQIDIETDGTDPVLKGDLTQIRQVVMNLITNAGESISTGNGNVKVIVSTQVCDGSFFAGRDFTEKVTTGTYASILVQDNGCGMDKDTLRQMFDPFFSTKETGHGLGLSAVIGIVKGHTGTIEVRSKPNSGTTITLLFPVADSSEDETLPAINEIHANNHSGTILFVDDEEDIRDLARLVLEDFGFNVIEAKDGHQAIQIFRAQSESIQLVMLDLMMPTKSGLQAYDELVAINSDVPIVFSSGFNESEALSHLPPTARTAFLKKPYLAEELRQFVQKVIQELEH